MSRKDDDGRKVFARNRAARHNYLIVEELEAGLVLTGAEVKSVRAGKVVLKDAFASVQDGEVFLHNMHISPYTHARVEVQDPERSRKLLLHRREILKLQRQIRQDGLTVVPLRLYLGRGVIKCELGVAKGKKTHDKRAAKKEESARREMRNAMGRQRKGI
ncbi:MAG: SsrA-binding protein SmpB [Acidobacteria bacterium]|jgi:SsrA-binding protein|nr:SsrA-binding protein SmpB [Acidobacteriota bacterium]MCZ6747306.1 SsrA-binding protein SmpB [Acidobacteriota bacterium]